MAISFVRLRTASALSGLMLLAACATLPASGPTAGEIRRGTKPDLNTIGFRIVDIDANVIGEMDKRTAEADAAQPTLSSLQKIGRNDVVGAGDVLTIGVYEVGVSLFGTGRELGQAYDPSAHSEPFPEVVVDRQGAISLPYVGRLNVAGRTPGEIEGMIETALKGKSQNPQALVGVKRNISSTVYVAGDVRRPGRFDLTLQGERLLDAIALAGGAANSSEDTIVRFNRGNQTLEERLGRVRSAAPDDLVLIPGDRVELIKRPRSFIVMGATSKVSQVAFETGDLSLAEAVARVGGPNDLIADPAAVFLFRYDPGKSGETPIVYRLNMLQPSSYFLSQKFAIRDKDVIYIANAAANRPAKLVNILNQLFTPLLTVRAITQ